MKFNDTFDFSAIDPEVTAEFMNTLADEYDTVSDLLTGIPADGIPALADDIKACLLKDGLLSAGQQREWADIYLQELNLPEYSILSATDPLYQTDVYALLHHKYWEQRSGRYGVSFKLIFSVLSNDMPRLAVRVFVSSRESYKSNLMSLPRLSVCRLSVNRTAKGYPVVTLVDKPALFDGFLAGQEYHWSGQGQNIPFKFSFAHLQELQMACYHFDAAPELTEA
jgi:hypothetical protein